MRRKTLLEVETKVKLKVSLRVGKGVLSVMDVQEGEDGDGQNERNLTISSTDLEKLNDLLSRVTYTSTVYHIKTEDLGKNRLAFVTFFQLTSLLRTMRSYSRLRSDVFMIQLGKDDSHNPEKIDGDNIEHYIMPPAQGWFAGRNLAVSQVTTKYFLWVDDNFLFLNETRMRVLCGEHQFYDQVRSYRPVLISLGWQRGLPLNCSIKRESAMKVDATRVSEVYGPVPGLDGCFFADGVVNYFMGRTDALRRFFSIANTQFMNNTPTCTNPTQKQPHFAKV
ncbi:hypothetical protein IRJ41_022546 [Triplophysa rosa]|uniref:Glycosyltransferase 2-like domain-containing protein n=1 Tax=Triplophysa rosa TaxID=992332 RepID=A0A9W7X264_TRIRA|nr:hypothetical protein IRJ41_022546 [Triplophysa rosa]